MFTRRTKWAATARICWAAGLVMLLVVTSCSGCTGSKKSAPTFTPAPSYWEPFLDGLFYSFVLTIVLMGAGFVWLLRRGIQTDRKQEDPPTTPLQVRPRGSIQHRGETVPRWEATTEVARPITRIVASGSAEPSALVAPAPPPPPTAEEALTAFNRAVEQGDAAVLLDVARRCEGGVISLDKDRGGELLHRSQAPMALYWAIQAGDESLLLVPSIEYLEEHRGSFLDGNRTGAGRILRPFFTVVFEGADYPTIERPASIRPTADGGFTLDSPGVLRW